MWNKVLENFIALKTKFIEAYGEDALWDYGEYKNCIHYWASKFEYFQEMFEPLIITEYKDRVLLKYSLLDTDTEFWNKYDQMYRECRSVTIDKKRNCLVFVPFRKFFNVNEVEETQEREIRKRIVNAKHTEISDKLDGSMQSARYYDNECIMSGSGALDPDMSYQLALGYIMLTDEYEKMLKDYPNFSFIFEFIHESDSHVVVYQPEQNGLYLIGMRNVETGENLSYAEVIEIAEKYGVKHTTVFNKTFDQLINELDDKMSDEAEGFVIDIDGYKVKLKYNDYRKIHVMLSKVTSTNVIIKCIEDGTWDDVLSKIPQAYRAEIEKVANNVKLYVRKRTKQMKDLFEECKAVYPKSDEVSADKKAFAIYAKEHYKPYMHYLITLYNGKEINFLCNYHGKYIKYKNIMTWLEENEEPNLD